LKVENTSFDVVEFLQNRQKALSKLLNLKAADAGTTEYEQLRYEVTHMAERYEMLRSAYPQLGLRELTAEERRQFEENAAVHEKEHAAAIQKLTRDQRSMVDTRLQSVRPDTIAALSRNNLILSASLYNEKDAADRLRREEQRRQQAQLRAEREQIRLEEERLRQEQEQARAREAAQASAEAARQQLKRREERLSEHAALPLTTRLREAIDELRRAKERYQALKKEPVDAEALKEAAINHREAISRADDLLHETIRAGAGNGEGSVTAEALTELLNAELGADRAKPILDKLRGGINESTNLMKLTAPERLRVLGALAGSLSPEAQAERLAADDAFTRVDGMQLTGSPYTLVRTRSGERLVTDPSYRAQVSQRTDFHATIDQVRGEMYHDFKGTRREWSELNAALDYADMTLRIPSADLRQRVFDNGAAHGSYMEKKQKTNVREQLKKPENPYMNDLTEGKGEVFDPPRADKTLQIRRMKSERMNLDPEYVKHVADILRRMERLGITREDAPAEEGNKVYAFHVFIKAQKELKDAIASKDRERILAATARVKEVRHEMDEMMRIAAENFHPTDYMDNLDVARNRSIPWEYGRDIVHSAQLNGLYLFGNLLKDSGISIDEFEKDPGAAIAQAENRRREQLTGINAYAKGKSAGTLFADADTEALGNGATAGGQMATGQYMRAVGALVSTEPAKDPAQHARNDFLFRRIYEFNTDIDAYQNGRSFGNLKNGIGNKTTEGRNALRALVSVEEKDIDPERMFATIPIAPDGTRMEPFDLAEYYRRKPAYDYAAQGNRLEGMLADAAKEHDRLLTKKRSYPEHAQIPIELNDVTKRNFHPYELLKARQEALTQLLTIRSFDRNQPGYAALEEEALHMSERYEAFRQAHPELKNLPELTGEQKAALTAGSKAYENLKNNREKLMAAEEKRIAREAGRQEKLFIDALKDLNKEVEKREKRLGKLMLDKNPSMEDVRRTSNSLNKAVEARESLKQRRALSLMEDYKAGKLPEAYVTEQLKTLSLLTQNQNRPPETLPLFGKQLDNRVAEGNRRRARELFLQDRLLENMGLTVKQSVTQPTDTMLPYLSALGIADPKPVAEAGQALQQPAGPQAAAVGGKAAVPDGQAAVPDGKPQDNINKVAEDQAMAENEIGEEPEQPVHEEPPREERLNGQNPPHTDDEIAPKIRDLDFNGMMQRVGGQHEERQHVRRNSVNEINAGPRLEGDPEVRQQAQQAGPGKS
ncbi:MAG: hypothetical protein II800_04515, partial [Lachnospiraceae bacterium]|nr:hypothetical protein [Lachnospiraceae bacterium]